MLQGNKNPTERVSLLTRLSPSHKPDGVETSPHCCRPH